MGSVEERDIMNTIKMGTQDFGPLKFEDSEYSHIVYFLGYSFVCDYDKSSGIIKPKTCS